MSTLLGFLFGFGVWFVVRCVLGGLYTVNQNERAVKTIFGRADRIAELTTLDDPIAEHLTEDQKERYRYPQVRVIAPGGPYFKWPWERIYKVSIATQTVNMALDPEDPLANQAGTVLEAVTKDQLNIGLNGQIRFRVSERNLYGYLFGIKRPYVHVMGYFISVLRERIANFEAPAGAPPALAVSASPPLPATSPPPLPATSAPALPESSQPALAAGSQPLDANLVTGVSINDLRKNLRDLNEHMERECLSSVARYGILLDASLITGIDPPPEVESALAAINTAHNNVSSSISLAQAAADQRIVQSRRAVEIETLDAQAEVEPLKALASQLGELRKHGPDALPAYLRNVRIKLLGKAREAILELRKGDR